MVMTLTETGVDRYVVEFDHFQRELAGREPERIGKLRHEAFERFVEMGFPTVRQEQWRFTNVAPIARTEFKFQVSTDQVKEGDLARYRYADCAQLTVVNGQFRPDLSRVDGLPEVVQATVNVRVVLLVAASLGVEHCPGLLSRGGVV